MNGSEYRRGRKCKDGHTVKVVLERGKRERQELCYCGARTSRVVLRAPARRKQVWWSWAA